jgi:hypothetical protein
VEPIGSLCPFVRYVANKFHGYVATVRECIM